MNENLSLNSARNPNFDAAKGYLLVLVIIGHVINGPNTVKVFIYFFHMPLFLAVSGYFIKPDLLAGSYSNMFFKYWPRLILPFLLAFLIYTSLAVGSGLRSFDLTLITYPFYHLWYVPAIIFYLVVTKCFTNLKVPILLILAFSGSLTLIRGSIGWSGIYQTFSWLSSLGDARFYDYYFYFLLGHYLGSYQPFRLGWPIIIILALNLVLYNFNNNIWLTGLTIVIINACLIMIMLEVCEKFPSKNRLNSWMSKLGKVSLPVYLWHLVGIIAGYKMTIILTGRDSYDNTMFYYPASIICVVITCLVIIRLEGRWPLINKLFYGKA